LEDSQEPTEEASISDDGIPEQDVDEKELDPLNVELTLIQDEHGISTSRSTPTPSDLSSDDDSDKPKTPLYDDPSDEDDGEGDWITPENAALHKSKALDLLPEDGVGSKKKDEIIDVGCMTADFAMQNVLLQMGLDLVGLEGRRIEKVKTWVLRCHACFK
jgi:RNA-binding protein NOB1